MPLLDRHVRFLDQELDAQFLASSSSRIRREVALAGLANLTLWLLWLCSMETFSTEWSDLEISPPRDTVPPDPLLQAGFTRWWLQDPKGQRGRVVDTICAFSTLSGLSMGKWVLRARKYSPGNGAIFCHPNGARWNSAYFREKYLYPSLYRQQHRGDPALTPFTDRLGNRIEDKFWSLHCYRRGSRSHVSLSRTLCTTSMDRANATQVYVHGRWSTSRSNEPIDKQYLHWGDWEKLQITLRCH